MNCECNDPLCDLVGCQKRANLSRIPARCEAAMHLLQAASLVMQSMRQDAEEDIDLADAIDILSAVSARLDDQLRQVADRKAKILIGTFGAQPPDDSDPFAPGAGPVCMGPTEEQIDRWERDRRSHRQ